MNTINLRTRLKMRHLLLLEALGDVVSLNQAARRVFITQPAATVALAEIETTLGSQLFERSSRGLLPTPIGRVVMAHARRILAAVDQAQDNLAALADGSAGIVRVGTLLPPSMDLLPASIAALKARFPLMRITVEQMPQDPMLARLKNGDLDIGLLRLVTGPDEAELQQTVLYRDAYCVIAHPNHAMMQRRSVKLSALVDEPWILPPLAGPLRTRLDTMFIAEAGRVPVHHVSSVSLPCNLHLITQYAYLGAVTLRTAAFYRAQARVAVLPVRLGDLMGPYAAVLLKEKYRAPAVQLFLDELCRLAAGMPPTHLPPGRAKSGRGV